MTESFKNFRQFSTDCPTSRFQTQSFNAVCQARVQSREASVEINYYSALRLPPIIHSVLKYPHSEFHLNLMNTSSFTTHFCSKVYAVMLAVDRAAEFRQQSCRATLLARVSWVWKCGDRLPALGGPMVRVTCHTEISQNTTTQAYTERVSRRIHIYVAFVKRTLCWINLWLHIFWLRFTD